jgi:hypothetical protein
MLFHSISDPTVYVQQFTARLRDLDVDRFEAAWRTVVQLHPILRTVPVGGGGSTVLAVLDA